MYMVKYLGSDGKRHARYFGKRSLAYAAYRQFVLCGYRLVKLSLA